jgi:hypothetical protein
MPNALFNRKFSPFIFGSFSVSLTHTRHFVQLIGQDLEGTDLGPTEVTACCMTKAVVRVDIRNRHILNTDLDRFLPVLNYQTATFRT